MRESRTLGSVGAKPNGLATRPSPMGRRSPFSSPAQIKDGELLTDRTGDLRMPEEGKAREQNALLTLSGSVTFTERPGLLARDSPHRITLRLTNHGQFGSVWGATRRERGELVVC